MRDDVLAPGRYAGRVRYADGGGLTAAARTRREKVRLQAAEMFAAGLAPPQVARQLRVSQKSAYAWRRTWKAGGAQALASQGPGGSPCQLTVDQLTRLAKELDAGPAAHGYLEDQRWTLARIAKLITERFGVCYSLRGVSYLLHRLGFSAQVPVHRAAERDEKKITQWKEATWPRVKGQRGSWARGSSLPTSPVSRCGRPRPVPGPEEAKRRW